MSSIEIVYLVLLIGCLVLSAFFCASETALSSVQRIKLEHMMHSGIKGATRVDRMIRRPEEYLSVVLMGINLANTGAAALATALAISFWGEQGIIYATLSLTVILLVFSETTPKIIARRHSERLAISFTPLLKLFSWLFFPIVFVLSWIASLLTKLVGGTPVHRSLASDEEIRTMISVGHREGTVEEAEAKLLDRVFEFGDRPVREVTVPRTEVVAVETRTTLRDFLRLYAENPLSRFPVYEENMDNVVGILSIKDVLMAEAKGTVTRESGIDELVRPAYFAPETKKINELFAEMQEKNFRMAVVVDEFGGTAGVVSLSRLVEEIVGPVGDELAEVEKEYEVINEYTFQIDGGMRIEEANQEMELGIPEGEYETVAGFVLNLLGRIPKIGEQLRYRGLKIVITKMRGVKIDEILLTKEKSAASTN
jgi:putative hemolysin